MNEKKIYKMFSKRGTKHNKTKMKTAMPSQKLVKEEIVNGMSKTEFENYIGKILIANRL